MIKEGAGYSSIHFQGKALTFCMEKLFPTLSLLSAKREILSTTQSVLTVVYSEVRLGRFRDCVLTFSLSVLFVQQERSGYFVNIDFSRIFSHFVGEVCN